MSGTSIRVSEEVRHRLEMEKRENESFDDVLRRLTSSDKWNGFGALADEEEDTGEGMERVRGQFQDGFDGDVEEFES